MIEVQNGSTPGAPPQDLTMALSTSQQSLWLPSLTRPNRKSTSTHLSADVCWSGITRTCAIHGEKETVTVEPCAGDI